MFRGIGLALAFIFSSPLWACEDLLRSNLQQLTTSNFKVTAGAERDLRMLNVTLGEFESFVQANLVFVLNGERADFWSVVFEPNIRHADRGYKITGSSRGGVFYAERIEKAYRDDEMEYFKAVARVHNIQAVQLPLSKALLNCQALVVENWVQVKLWLKHRLPLERVRALFEGKIQGPALDNHHHKKPRYLISGLHTAKSYFQAVVAGDGLCPNTLITAFEVAR